MKNQSSLFTLLFLLFSYVFASTAQEWYPLHIGNYWIYKNTYVSEISPALKNITIQWISKVEIIDMFPAEGGIFVARKLTCSKIQYHCSESIPKENIAWFTENIPPKFTPHYFIKHDRIYEIPAHCYNIKTRRTSVNISSHILTASHSSAVFYFPLEDKMLWADKRKAAEFYRSYLLTTQNREFEPKSGLYQWNTEKISFLKTGKYRFYNLYKLSCKTQDIPVSVWFKKGVGIVKIHLYHNGNYSDLTSELISHRIR